MIWKRKQDGISAPLAKGFAILVAVVVSGMACTNVEPTPNLGPTIEAIANTAVNNSLIANPPPSPLPTSTPSPTVTPAPTATLFPTVTPSPTIDISSIVSAIVDGELTKIRKEIAAQRSETDNSLALITTEVLAQDNEFREFVEALVLFEAEVRQFMASPPGGAIVV